MPAPTRGRRVANWIERYCLSPHGPDRGQPVKLTAEQRQTILKTYDHPSGLQDFPGTPGSPLAAYIALMHVCGPEAAVRNPAPARLAVDTFTMWSACGPDLREVLRRSGERITCPELGTQWPRAAA